MEKINRSYIRYTRYAIQVYVLCFLIYAGYRFYLFVEHYENPGSGTQIVLSLEERPASIEGFLPIGALMSLKLWVRTGFFDQTHPAGLVIFIAALLMAFLLKKSFCGWICPVGALSDALWKLRQKLFAGRLSLPSLIDHMLRSLKYVLLGLFIFIIIFKMSPPAIAAFIGGDYYKVADVKMLYFFTRMSSTTMISLLVLTVLSLAYRNFWCRYLCPYGGLLGLVGLFSPIRIYRNSAACIRCSRCTDNCPSSIPVEKLPHVLTAECSGCLTCISHCPAKGALEAAVARRFVLHPLAFIILVIMLFFGTLGLGRIAGKWKSAVTADEYQRIIPATATLDHP